MNSTITSIIGLLIALFGGLVALAYKIGVERGHNDIREEQERESEKAEKEREKIEEDIKKRPDEQIDKDIDKWMRD